MAEIEYGPTSWYDGTRTEVALSFANLGVEDWIDVTVALWCYVEETNATETWRTLFNFYNISYGAIALQAHATLASLNVGPVTVTFSINAWHHVVWAYKRSLDTGETYNHNVYIDGVLAGSSVGFALALGSVTTINIGHNSGSIFANGVILDDVIVIPACMPAAWAAATYALGTAYTYPNLLIGGDVVSYEAYVRGLVESEEFVPARNTAGTWINNYRRLDLKLEEV